MPTFCALCVLLSSTTVTRNESECDHDRGTGAGLPCASPGPPSLGSPSLMRTHGQPGKLSWLQDGPWLVGFPFAGRAGLPGAAPGEKDKQCQPKAEHGSAQLLPTPQNTAGTNKLPWAQQCLPVPGSASLAVSPWAQLSCPWEPRWG